MSKEYSVALVLVLGSLLKVFFGVEIENDTLEGFVVGLAAIAIAIFRYAKGDITPLGAKK